MYELNLNTQISIGLVCLGYLVYLVRSTSRNHIDIFDLILLTSVAIVPLIFTFFPSIGTLLTQITGVGFPFLLLFGGLFLIIFIHMNHLIIQLNRLRHQNRIMIQELGLLRLELENSQRGHSIVSSDEPIDEDSDSQES